MDSPPVTPSDTCENPAVDVELAAALRRVDRWLDHELLELLRFRARRKTSSPVTIIEIRPFRNGWKCFEAPGVEAVFSDQEQAIDYAKNRACFRSGEIRILDCNDTIQRSIPFAETDRRL